MSVTSASEHSGSRIRELTSASPTASAPPSSKTTAAPNPSTGTATPYSGQSGYQSASPSFQSFTAGTNKNPTALECFPVVGKNGQSPRYNIGYDSSYNNFNPFTGTQNSDFSRAPTNAAHKDGHLGVDIFAPRGQPVVAPVSGTVVAMGMTSEGGNRVTIKRGNEYFYLAHLDTLDKNVKVGQSIGAGTPIGTVGNTGSARGTEPHIHFSIYKDGDYKNSVDPFPSLYAAHQEQVNTELGVAAITGAAKAAQGA